MEGQEDKDDGCTDEEMEEEDNTEDSTEIKLF